MSAESTGNPQEPTAKQREFIASLRQVADFFEEHPQLPTPCNTEFHVHFWPAAGKPQLRTFARAFSDYGGVKKDVFGEHGNDPSLKLVGRIGTLEIWTSAERAKVCVRRQTGTRTIPATPALPECVQPAKPGQPERIEPLYDWDCGPFLKPDLNLF